MIDELSEKVSASSVYLELWARVFDEGIVSIPNEKEFALAAGYTGNRAVRTMNERLLSLIELGFIKAKPDFGVDYGQILLVNPLQVCVDLKASRPIDEAWWSAFVRRSTEVGAALPAPRHRKTK